jgi:hypothetical protein
VAVERLFEYGADPECLMLRGHWFNEAFVFVNSLRRALPEGVGVDGAEDALEFRPAPGSPEQVVDSLRALVLEAERRAFRRGLALDCAGHLAPIGFHVHISWSALTYVDRSALLLRIDNVIGEVCLSVSGRARGGYASRAAMRRQTYPGRIGLEYRTPGAAFLCCPPAALSLLQAVAAAAEGRPIPAEFWQWADWLKAAVRWAQWLPVFWSRNWPAKLRRYCAAFGLPEFPGAQALAPRAVGRLREEKIIDIDRFQTHSRGRNRVTGPLTAVALDLIATYADRFFVRPESIEIRPAPDNQYWGRRAGGRIEILVPQTELTAAAQLEPGPALRRWALDIVLSGGGLREGTESSLFVDRLVEENSQ